MFPADLPFDASCVLVWLPEGITPTDASFKLSEVQAPPAANPEAYWFYHEALISVMTVERNHDKLPWIKFGTYTIDEDKIKSEYRRLLGSREASE